MSKIYEFINNGKIMQLKDGYMRIVTPTERDSHEFELSDIIGVNNFEENLPAVFELIKEGYTLSHKPDAFDFQKLKELNNKIDKYNDRIEAERQRHEEEKTQAAAEFKEGLQDTINDISLPVVEKYRSEIVSLEITNTDPLQGKLIIEASKAKNPADLNNLRGTTKPFEDDTVVFDPDKPNEINFELVND